jgi:uncharacterized protein (DUF2147 family)
MKVWTFIAIVQLTAINAFGGGPGDILDSWKTDGGKSELDFFRCGDNICGKIVSLKEPTYSDSKEGPVGTLKVDRKNHDPTLRNHPIIGLQVVVGGTATGDNRWGDGSCYDPESGKTYR